MIAKKHIKRINELLNSESVAMSIVRVTPAGDRERLAFWVQQGHKAATTLRVEYGVHSSAGSVTYWDTLAQHFPNPHQE